MAIGAAPIGSFPIGAVWPPGNAGVPLGGDYSQWEVPPFTPVGYRRLLDTAGIDVGAQERARLDQARREIGLLKDEEPPPLPVEIEVAPVEVRIETPPPLPEPLLPEPTFDKAAYAQVIADALVAEIRRDDAEKAELVRLSRIEWVRRDDEAVLALLAAV